MECSWPSRLIGAGCRPFHPVSELGHSLTRPLSNSPHPATQPLFQPQTAGSTTATCLSITPRLDHSSSNPQTRTKRKPSLFIQIVQVITERLGMRNPKQKDPPPNKHGTPISRIQRLSESIQPQALLRHILLLQEIQRHLHQRSSYGAENLLHLSSTLRSR